MVKSVKKKISTKLQKLGFDPKSTNYISLIVEDIVNREINPLDIVLTKDAYPVLLRHFFLTESSSETYIRREIKRAWKEGDHRLWFDELQYDSRPTLKKLIVSLLLQFEY